MPPSMRGPNRTPGTQRLAINNVKKVPKADKGVIERAGSEVEGD